MNLTKKKLRILVVEDAPGDVFLIKFYLEELDPDYYVIEDVDNLNEAHEKLASSDYDIVLLDLHLPDSEGLVTLTNSIEKFPDEVFIVMTGLSDQSIGLEAVRLGAQDFLVKGRLDSKALDSAIKFAFQRAELKRAVKVFNHALKAMEQMHNFRGIIYNSLEQSIDHSDNLVSFLGIDDSIKAIDDFSNYTDSSHFDKIKTSIANTTVNNDVICLENIPFNGNGFTFKFSKSENLKNYVIISVSKS